MVQTQGNGELHLIALEQCGINTHWKKSEFCLYAIVCINGEDTYTWLLDLLCETYFFKQCFKKNEASLGGTWFREKWERGMRQENRIQRKAQKKSQLWIPFIFNFNCDPKHSDAVKNLIFQAKKKRQTTTKWKHIFFKL